MEPIVRVERLTRSFDDIDAVKQVSFDLFPGQVTGFIGANGAGKTTTMRMMATLELPDDGRVLIDGVDTIRETHRVKGLIGWMPDSYGRYEVMTVFEYLDFFARAYGFTGKDREERVRDVMEFTELGEISERFTDTLSKGMGQRLCLGRTLLHDPPVLILDEPAAGLDPKARVEFKHLVKLLAQENKTLLISSHILSELEDMCDSFLFIDNGQLIHDGKADVLKRTSTTAVVLDVKISGDIEKLIAWLSLQPGAKIIEQIRNGVRLELQLDDAEACSTLLRRLIEAGFLVYDFHEHQRKLEEVFVDIIRKRSLDED